jgi:tetratricopeptide (TPR) repeat protein
MTKLKKDKDPFHAFENKSIDSFTKEYISHIPPNPLESQKVRENRARHTIKDALDQSLSKPLKGYQAILEEIALTDPETSGRLLVRNLLHTANLEKMLSVEGDLASYPIIKEIESGEKGIRDIMGIPQEFDSYFLVAAEKFFINHNYEKASDAFCFLALLMAERADVWIKWGLSQQFNKHYEDALISYTVAIGIDDQNPFPYCYCAECWLALAAKENALEKITKCLELLHHDPKQKDLEEYCLKLKTQTTKKS